LGLNWHATYFSFQVAHIVLIAALESQIDTVGRLKKDGGSVGASTISPAAEDSTVLYQVLNSLQQAYYLRIWTYVRMYHRGKLSEGGGMARPWVRPGSWT